MLHRVAALVITAAWCDGVAPDTTPQPTNATTPAPEPQPTPAPDTTPQPTNGTTTPAPEPQPTPTPAGGVQIQSAVSSLCVDLPSGDTSNGALLWMWDCYGGDTQQWAFQDGQLVYLPDPSKCVDLLGGDTTNGNQLGIWDCYQGDSQLWGFDSELGTIYLSSSTASDATKCAQIGGENKGDPLVIWDCAGEPHQVWTVSSSTPSPDPTSAPETTPQPTNGTTTPAPEPQPTPAADTTPQPTNGTTTPAPEPQPTPTPAGGVQIQSAVSSLCVDLPSGDTSNGALLWTWDCYGGANQQWSFQDGQLVYLPDPSKCVDLLGGDTTNGNQLGIWDCSHGDSQLWGFDSELGTIYLSSSTASDATKCAQIGGGNKGDPLVIWDCTIEPEQVWWVGSPQLSLVVV